MTKNGANLLLGDQFAPLTSTIGFLRLGLEQAVDGFLRWQEVIQLPRGVVLTRRTLEGDVASLLRALPPLTSHEPRRFLFVPTVGEWTAYFDNSYRGSDATGPMAYLARTLGCQSLRMTVVPHQQHRKENGKWTGRYGGTMLDVFGPTVVNHVNTIRSIAMLNDGGRWVFETGGEPFPFEETATYTARKVRDRFPVELLARYLTALGLEPFDKHFYRREGVLAEKVGPSAAQMREFSLEEIRATF